ncbi:SMC family ATPase [Microbacterium sp. EYE_5]|uniref:AAA family ATPase n=1 Tax=unclassified Microbacterium TaxID=2609290 RepID=UPI00200305E9|nr:MULTISPECIES: SMC family ATPase [unclassified Microbacterium]MCK6080113.1 SMC family ATPase [Microbacterium sp. EYE_382]MCK6085384.1 SMC family ATPase [Microbacterium sp. EYE_384]MCK6122391.1 SMC family ATPase [Microbacterium sp. EYE_80]MCK6126147.1 SMC family ATPase [Microbacterium sp. EYE_79]MCK6141068.1 SMC family ATPase [Microbacterium sp. EYE_39]
MKVHRLELTGFGPFRARQVVDFDAFDDDGLFLISGRTGAGKSSILDGVSFALYGSVPRYENGDRRLRSDHSFVTDPTEVRLEFTVGGSRWRVTRAPEYERPAKRGGGLTLEPARAELEERVDGAWIGRAAKQREVGLALDEVLGLSAQQFQQVILLAQNKFSRFLLAANAERQQLLRTLFGTKRFEAYKDGLEQRRRDAQRRVDEGGARVRTLLEVAERDVAANALGGDDEALPDADVLGRTAAVQRALARAQYRVEIRGNERDAAVVRADAAAAAHRRLTEVAQRIADLGAARRELAAREADVPQMDALRGRLEDARIAELLRLPIETAARADRELADALTSLAGATDAWRTVAATDDGDPADVVERLTADLARAQSAGRLESESAALRRAQEERRDRLAAVEASRSEIEAMLAAVPTQRQTVAADLSRVLAVAGRRDDLQATRDDLARRRDAARAVLRFAPQAVTAEAEYAAANARAAAASALVGELLRRRLRGHAAELAASLVPGEPCAVCGATEHPRPAEGSEAPVTDDDLTAAEDARDTAAELERSAAAAAASAREAVALAAAGAGGRDADELTLALADVEAQLAAAEAAVSQATSLQTASDDLDALEQTARAEAASLREAEGDLREQVAAAQTAIDASQRDIDAARGAHDTVAARIAADEHRRAIAVRVVDAQRLVDERERAAVAARRDRDDRVAASVFADIDAVDAALLTDAERERAARAVEEHAAALTAARARSLELELAVVDEHVDDAALAAAAALADEAEAARTAAIAAAAAAEGVAGGLRDLASRIEVAAAAVSDEAQDAAAITRLADTVAGRAPNTMKMDLETFVLAAELEEIVAAANLRLTEMSSGRYTLRHSDARQARGAASGLSIEVLDAHTGRLRSPQSLSGGETFLASLALALGLAEVVTSRAGGIRLDTLFIDEGFGSLDPETLELAMRTLDELRAGGRVVGVISHVEAMKEQIPAQLVVEATPEGPSVVRQDAASPIPEATGR